MIRRIIYIVVIILGIFTFNRLGVTMDYIEHGQFKVYYSAQSREIAERLMNITEKSYPVFKDLFRADHDVLSVSQKLSELFVKRTKRFRTGNILG